MASCPGGEGLEVLKVPEASHWAESLEGTRLKEVRYDWVFGTDYGGELMGSWAREMAGDDACETVLDGDEEAVAKAQAVSPSSCRC